MRRPLSVAVLVTLVLALTLACSPSRLFGGDLGAYVGKVGAPLQEFAGWAQEVLAFANTAAGQRDAEAICSDATLSSLVTRGREITEQLQVIEPPSAVQAPHDAVTAAADNAVSSLAKANELICEKKDLAGGLEALQGALGPMEDLLGKLQELQKLLPSS
ncbi:MAG: hypothetical protein GXX93_07645 [Anaerolineae bacterium]|nr:hypothetical protein [Anaerolineae bacterium]